MREASKMLSRNQAPPKGGDYLKMLSWSRRRSSRSWFWIYSPNRLFILANGGDPVASCPEMLPGEVRPASQIVPSNVNRTLSFDEPYRLSY